MKDEFYFGILRQWKLYVHISLLGYTQEVRYFYLYYSAASTNQHAPKGGPHIGFRMLVPPMIFEDFSQN